MSLIDCEIPEFADVTEPIARKRHRCCECGSPIHAGEKHVKCSGKWEGDLETFRQHTACAEACEFIRDTQGECIAFGSLFEELHEYDWNPRNKRDEKSRKLRGLVAIILRRVRAEKKAKA